MSNTRKLQGPGTKNNNRLLQAIIVIFTFALYANTLGHQYALDDKMVYWNNGFVQNGFKGIKDILSHDTMAGMFGKDSRELEGGRYRPLSLVTFALEVEFFGKQATDIAAKDPFKGNPWVSHFINILLYCVSLLILYKVLLKLFRDYIPKYKWLNIPFITTLLFAAHPLHTEIVANIKGRDEILAFLFSIAALNSIINYFDKNNKTELINSFIFIFLGAMSKEIAITFLAVIPLSIYFFRNKQSVSKYIISMIPLAVGVILYLILREMAIGNQASIDAKELMNNPFLGMTISQKYATITLTLLLYLRLLVFPHPQTWDYYPYHIPVVEWSDWRVILSIIIHLILVVIAIYGFRKKTIYSYGILIYAATLSITSNVFFNIGAFMSERFLFVSLLGFCVIIAYLISAKLPEKIVNVKMYKKTGITIFTLILLIYSIKTITRNRVWENNLVLFGHDVKVSHNSAKSNSSYASELYKLAEDAIAINDTATRNKYFLEAIPYFEKAIEIYPDFSEALVRLGNIYYTMNGDYKTMFKYYIKALEKSPLDVDVWGNTTGLLVRNIDEPEYEKQIWLKYQELSPAYFESYFQMGNLYYHSSEPQYDSAIYYYEKAIARNVNDSEIFFQLGRSYGFINDFVKARENLLKASAIKEHPEIYKFIGVTYGMEGKDILALDYFEKALRLDPGNEEIKNYIFIAKQRME